MLYLTAVTFISKVLKCYNAAKSYTALKIWYVYLRTNINQLRLGQYQVKILRLRCKVLRITLRISFCCGKRQVHFRRSSVKSLIQQCYSLNKMAICRIMCSGFVNKKKFENFSKQILQYISFWNFVYAKALLMKIVECIDRSL